nr:hypothetical protein CFP56_64189 [Quercus suber]
MYKCRRSVVANIQTARILLVVDEVGVGLVSIASRDSVVSTLGRTSRLHRWDRATIDVVRHACVVFIDGDDRGLVVTSRRIDGARLKQTVNAPSVKFNRTGLIDADATGWNAVVLLDSIEVELDVWAVGVRGYVVGTHNWHTPIGTLTLWSGRMHLVGLVAAHLGVVGDLAKDEAFRTVRTVNRVRAMLVVVELGRSKAIKSDLVRRHENTQHVQFVRSPPHLVGWLKRTWETALVVVRSTTREQILTGSGAAIIETGGVVVLVHVSDQLHSDIERTLEGVHDSLSRGTFQELLLGHLERVVDNECLYVMSSTTLRWLDVLDHNLRVDWHAVHALREKAVVRLQEWKQDEDVGYGMFSFKSLIFFMLGRFTFDLIADACDVTTASGRLTKFLEGGSHLLRSNLRGLLHNFLGHLDKIATHAIDIDNSGVWRVDARDRAVRSETVEADPVVVDIAVHVDTGHVGKAEEAINRPMGQLARSIHIMVRHRYKKMP